MLDNSDKFDFIPLPENINFNENSNVVIEIKLTKKEKNYLNHKRKRSPEISLISNIVNKEEEKKEIKFKFQDFSKNALSVIFSFLTFNDLLKLKNVGCRNIFNYINELIEMKKNKGCFKLKLMKTIKANIPLSDSDSIPCKKYFCSNLIYSDSIPANSHIKYMIYHKQSNKYYCLMKNAFNYYFCSYSKEEISANKYKNYTILFSIKELDYIEKFQFIDENKVAFFSLTKIALYDISNSNNYKYNIIYLSHTCDYILFKKSLNLLIIPHSSYKYISFFHLSKSSLKKINKEKNKINIYHKINCDCKDGQIIDLCGNLIGYFCSCIKHVKIIDCKKMKLKKIVKLNNTIKNVEINKKYLIVYTADNCINFFDSVTFEKKYDYQLAKCDIKNILLFEPFYFDNIFFIIKNNNKSCLIYLEKDNSSFIPIDNEINIKEIKSNNYITNSLNKQIKEENDTMFEINTKMICDEYPKNEYIINDYTLIL